MKDKKKKNNEKIKEKFILDSIIIHLKQLAHNI